MRNSKARQLTGGSWVEWSSAALTSLLHVVQLDFRRFRHAFSHLSVETVSKMTDCVWWAVKLRTSGFIFTFGVVIHFIAPSSGLWNPQHSRIYVFSRCIDVFGEMSAYPLGFSCDLHQFILPNYPFVDCLFFSVIRSLLFSAVLFSELI